MGKEEDVAGLGYVLSFYNDIINLTNSYAAYAAIILQLSEKYPDDLSLSKGRGMSEEERLVLLQTSGAARTFIISSYTKLYALQALIPELKITKELEDIYERAKKRTVLLEKDVEIFNLEVNKCFASGTLKDMMFKIDSYLSKLV